MFGKKNKKQKKADSQNASEVQTPMNVMPPIFYGGKDPVIYKSSLTNEQNISSKIPEKKLETKKLPADTLNQDPSQISESSNSVSENKIKKVEKVSTKQKVSKRSIFIIAVVILVLVFLIVIIIWRQNSQKDFVPTRQNIFDTPSSTFEPVVPNPTSTDTFFPPLPSSQTSPTSSENLFEETGSVSSIISFPKIILQDSIDIDKDMLTDKEEEILGTDPGNPDTDEDSYPDGLEIKNLYNPLGFAPVKIIDSELVEEYTNPTWKYTLYYPKTWEYGTVEADAKQVLLSDISGDFVSIYAFSKKSEISFRDWFSEYAKGQQYSDLRLVITRSAQNSMMRKDGLVAYIYTDTEVFVFVYNTLTEQEIAFRHIFDMIVQSFVPNIKNNTNNISSQITIPQNIPGQANPFSSNTSTREETQNVSTSTLLQENDSIGQQEL